MFEIKIIRILIIILQYIEYLINDAKNKNT